MKTYGQIAYEARKANYDEANKRYSELCGHKLPKPLFRQWGLDLAFREKEAEEAGALAVLAEYMRRVILDPEPFSCEVDSGLTTEDRKMKHFLYFSYCKHGDSEFIEDFIECGSEEIALTYLNDFADGRIRWARLIWGMEIALQQTKPKWTKKEVSS
jgi:hypothetical protein